MRSEIKVIVALILVAVILGLGVIYLRVANKSPLVLNPFSKEINVLSYFIKRTEAPKYTIYGYLPYWELDNVKYLQYSNLTDIAYFGLNVKADGSFDQTEPGYTKWRDSDELGTAIKNARFSGTRFALTVLAHDSDASDSFLSCAACWETFAANLKTQLNYRGVSDINLNFEDAGYVDSPKADKYAEFVRYVKGKFPSSKVVVATFADSAVKPRVTSDLKKISEVSDGLFVMAYDFNSSTSDKAGPVAPISGKGVSGNYDISTMLKDYLEVVPASKIILGVPYYGYNWVVEDASKYSTRIEGNDTIGYSQSQYYSSILDLISDTKSQILWDDIAREPYFTYVSPETGSIRQVFYENTRSLSEKYDLIKSSGLAGVGIWALGYDDGNKELWNLLNMMFVK